MSSCANEVHTYHEQLWSKKYILVVGIWYSLHHVVYNK